MLYLGELCAVATAVCWTGSSMAFAVASRAVGGVATNQFRLLVAAPVLLALAWLVTGSPWPVELPAHRLGLLAWSGVVGLVLGDAGYFHALATIGPRVSSVVMTLWPAFALALGTLAGEWPGGREVLGVLVTIAGVVLVLLRSRESTAWRAGLSRRAWWSGVAGAVVGALGQAGGILLSRAAMAVGPDLPAGGVPLHATVVRMVCGAGVFFVVAAAQGRVTAAAQVVRDRTARRGALLGALFGPVCGVWLSMIAAHEARSLGAASALMATTPIFMMPAAAFAYRARIGWLGGLGTLVAVGGAMLCLTGA